MIKTFSRSSAAYPAEMRVQLWPLCCGAKIISGFKAVQNFEPEELAKQIVDVCENWTPDGQVYAGESLNPNLTFLTLNSGQIASKAIMSAITAAGFVQIGQGTPRNAQQGFFVRDPGKKFTVLEPKVAAAACGC